MKRPVVLALLLCLLLPMAGWGGSGLEFVNSRGSKEAPDSKTAQEMTLEDCIKEALSHSPYLLTSRYQWEAEKPRRLEEFSGFLPQVSLEYDLTRQTTELVSPYYQQYSGMVLTYNLFQGGQTTFSYLAARRDVEAARARYRETYIDTAFRVVVAFYDVLESKALWDAAKQDLRDAETNLAMAQARFKEGFSPYADVVRAKSSVAHAQFKMREREASYWVALGKLNIEMGRPVTEAIRLKGKLKEASFNMDFQKARDEAMQYNPFIREAEEQVEAQRYRRNVVYGEFLPRVDFQWRYGWTDTSFPANDYKEWSWQITVTVPIFSGFASRARLARARAQLEGQEFHLAQVKLEVEQSVWEAYQELEKNQANVHSAKARLKSATHDLHVTQGRYKMGLAHIVDLTTAQTNLAEARAQYISSLASLHRSMAALEKAMGKIPYLERNR